MSAESKWLLFVAIGLGTFLLRFLFIYLFGKIAIPDWLRRALRFVPAAALAALVFPALTHPAGHLVPLSSLFGCLKVVKVCPNQALTRLRKAVKPRRPKRSASAR